METVHAGDVQEKLVKYSGLPPISDTLVEKCAVLCNAYGVSVEHLLNDLDAFLVSQDANELTLESFGSFEQTIKSTKKTSQKQRRTEANSSIVTESPNLKRKKSDLMTPPSVKSQRSDSSTPDSQFSTVSSVLSQGEGGPNGIFQTRQDFGAEVVNFNGHLPTRGDFEPSKLGKATHGARCRVNFTEQDVFDNVLQRYRYMFTTLEERARALDEQLLRLQSDMCSAIGLPEENLAPLGLPSPEAVWICGRICNDSPSGKINKTSIVLEGSRIFSGGRRIELDLQSLPQYAVFPGQIVLVYGINSSGRKMVAEKMIEGIQKKLLLTSAKKISEFHHSELFQGGQALSVVVASGPFTTSDNLEYEPLNELLSQVATTKPDVLILVGPFVDASNNLLQSGDATLIVRGDDGNPEYGQEHSASYEMIFIEKIIRDGLKAYFNSADDFGGSLPTQIILVPSLLDAHHECVFPQPPFGDRDRVDASFFEEPLGLLDIPFSSPDETGQRVYLAPNPCMLRINEVVFGICSNDALFALSSDEISKQPGHRMCRMAGHLLQQQSFSPHFPPPPSALAQLDLRHSRHWQMNVSPDVLIVPSRLSPLAKEVLGTLVINPGSLAKGIRGGSYATLSINPLPPLSTSGDEEVLRQHDVVTRTNVTVCKI